MKTQKPQAVRLARVGTIVLLGVSGALAGMSGDDRNPPESPANALVGSGEASGLRPGRNSHRSLQLARPYDQARSAVPAPQSPAPEVVPARADPAAAFGPLVAAGDTAAIRGAVVNSPDPGTIKAGLCALRGLNPAAARETASSLAQNSNLDPSLKTSLQQWADELGRQSSGWSLEE